MNHLTQEGNSSVKYNVGHVRAPLNENTWNQNYLDLQLPKWLLSPADLTANQFVIQG